METVSDIMVGADEAKPCEYCVWDGVAYWINDSTPVAQWIACDKCDWGNE